MLYKRILLILILILSCKNKEKTDAKPFFKGLKSENFINETIRTIPIDSFSFKKTIKFPKSIDKESKIKLSKDKKGDYQVIINYTNRTFTKDFTI